MGKLSIFFSLENQYHVVLIAQGWLRMIRAIENGQIFPKYTYHKSGLKTDQKLVQFYIRVQRTIIFPAKCDLQPISS